MNTFILPCAGLSTRYPNNRPKYLLTHPDGKRMFEKAIEGIDFDYDRLIITVLKQHCVKFQADELVANIIPQAEILILDEPTKCQAETIYLTLKYKNVKGYFVSKDCDCYIKISLPKTQKNFVVGLDLRNRLDITNVASKSFVIPNDHNKHVLIDILEKNVCSNYISIGIYGFKSAKNFINVYENISAQILGEIYPSHVISYMLGSGEHFYVYYTNDYNDYNDVKSWYYERDRYSTYFVDVDGTLFKNTGYPWSETIPLEKNIEVIKKLKKNGAQIVITTARPKFERAKLIRQFQKFGIEYDYIITDCNHSKRVLINDFSNSNPYPACEAINIPRDEDNLEEFICIQ